MIKVVSATVSKIGSQSTSAGDVKDESTEATVAEVIKDSAPSESVEIGTEVPSNNCADEWD